MDFCISFQGYSGTPLPTSRFITVCIGENNPSFYVENLDNLGGLVWYSRDTTNIVQIGGDSKAAE